MGLLVICVLLPPKIAVNLNTIVLRYDLSSFTVVKMDLLDFCVTLY